MFAALKAAVHKAHALGVPIAASTTAPTTTATTRAASESRTKSRSTGNWPA